MGKYTCLFILLFTASHGFTQNDYSGNLKYKVIYELIYQPDSTNIQSKKSEEMYLYLGENFSRFSSAGKAIRDDLKNKVGKSDNLQTDYAQIRRQIPQTAFNYYIYKDIPRQKYTYTAEIMSDKYRYTENKDLFNWKIHNKTDTISGFVVQKATTNFAGRDYTAWFTEKIPFADGPYKFNGLPGLILKVADDKEHYRFEMKGIRMLEQPIPLKFQEEDFIETTSKELTELQEEFQKDPIGFAKRALPGFNADYMTKSQKNRADRNRKERLKKENNPLELD